MYAAPSTNHAATVDARTGANEPCGLAQVKSRAGPCATSFRNVTHSLALRRVQLFITISRQAVISCMPLRMPVL